MSVSILKNSNSNPFVPELSLWLSNSFHNLPRLADLHIHTLNSTYHPSTPGRYNRGHQIRSASLHWRSWEGPSSIPANPPWPRLPTIKIHLSLLRNSRPSVLQLDSLENHTCSTSSPHMFLHVLSHMQTNATYIAVKAWCRTFFQLFDSSKEKSSQNFSLFATIMPVVRRGMCAVLHRGKSGRYCRRSC